MNQIVDSKITAFQVSLHTLLNAEENRGKVAGQVFAWREVKGTIAVEKTKRVRNTGVGEATDQERVQKTVENDLPSRMVYVVNDA